MYVHATLSLHPSLPFPLCALKSTLYVCVFIPALPLGSSVLLFKIPYMCVSIRYLFFSFWLTSLCMTDSRSIHLATNSSVSLAHVLRNSTAGGVGQQESSVTDGGWAPPPEIPLRTEHWSTDIWPSDYETSAQRHESYGWSVGLQQRLAATKDQDQGAKCWTFLTNPWNILQYTLCANPWAVFINVISLNLPSKQTNKQTNK